MGLHKLTAGDGYTYIAKPSIAADVADLLEELGGRAPAQEHSAAADKS